MTAQKGPYDAVIIGAGMSGLVCGCYLAKAGMKVLIAEQHHMPGGYCTSFKRGPFTFDAAAHSFGGYREDGVVRKVLKDLDPDQRLKIKRFDPTDIVITPDYTITFWSDLKKTIKEFQRVFPKESNHIKDFFYFLINPDPNFFVRVRGWSFNDLLEHYFSDNRLKSILSFPLYGDGGLPPSLMSAFIGCKIFREYLLDGGYYPEGSMQTLPDILTDIFQEFGGQIMLSTLVKRITVTDGKATGVVLGKDDFIQAKYVISNADSRQTFFKLVGRKRLGEEFMQKIENMTPSLSLFILYLGVKESISSLPIGTNIWFLSDYDLEKSYAAANKADIENLCGYMIRRSPDNKTVLAFLNVAFRDKAYWINNKKKITETLINKIEETTIPDLSKNILHKEAATPYTLYRYTFNYKGAAYGWACNPSQLADHELKKPSSVRNLYLTGHWITQGLGIPGVVHLGYDTAKLILRKEKCI